MAGWQLFIDKATGELVSEGSVVPEGIDTDRYEVRDVGTRPDWASKLWDPATKQVVDRPAPVLIDRLDDIEARFLADPDFAAVWSSLNAARKSQLRTGILRVLASFVGSRRFREENETVEID